MNLVNVNIKVPEGIVTYIEPQSSGIELLRNALILYPYIVNDMISHGKAAEILGVFKYELNEVYNSVGLPYASMDIKEIEKEIENQKKISQENRVKLSERLEDLQKVVEWGKEEQRLIRNRESIVEIQEMFKTARSNPLNKLEKYREMYKEISRLQPDETLQLVLEAETEEEKLFYELVSDFLLQKEQKKVIEKKLF